MKLHSRFILKNTIRYLNLFGLFLLLSGCLFWITEANENMIFIPEGSFLMGYNTENDAEWGDSDEEPVHEVFLLPYYIQKLLNYYYY